MKNRTYAPIDVIIVTKQRYVQLRECVRCICANTVKPKRILIIDNSPAFDAAAKRTIEHICKNGRIPLLYKQIPNKGVGNARNAGLRAVRDEYFAFIDDDECVNTAWIHTLYTFFKNHPSLDVVTGPKIPKYTKNYWNQIWNALTNHEYRFEGEVDFVASGNSAYRTRFIQEHRLTYDERFLQCSEDRAFSYLLVKNNAKILFTPELTILHDTRTSLRSFARQWFYYGESMHQYHAWYLGSADVHSLRKLPQTVRNLHTTFPVAVFSRPVSLWPGFILLNASFLTGFLYSFFRMNALTSKQS